MAARFPWSTPRAVKAEMSVATPKTQAKEPIQLDVIDPIALQFARGPEGEPAIQKEVVAMQNFMSASPWEAGDIFQEIQAVFAEEMQPSCREWPIGTVGVIDESGFVKQGTESVGVDRQWCGRLGNTANSQVGVYLVGVTLAGTAMLDTQLFLTEDWDKDRVRRKKTHVPKAVRFQSKPQIAAELIRRTRAAGHVCFDWIVAGTQKGDARLCFTRCSPWSRPLLSI